MNTASTSSSRKIRLYTFALYLLPACSGGGGGGQKCTKDSPPDGLYLWCNGAPDGLYYEKYTPGPCASGFCPTPVYEFSICLGPEHYNETGGTGSGEIELDTWTNDTANIEHIQSICVAECKNRDLNNNGNCEQNPTSGITWQVENYHGDVVPDPGQQIDDPWHLECFAPMANLAPSPSDTTIIPPGTSPAWPSSPTQTFSVNCVDFEGCAGEFDAPILGLLGYDDTSIPWGYDQGHADYLATTSGTSATTIAFVIKNGASKSSDTHSASGRIEYSAPDCGATECPFYLANLTLTNSTDTWQMYSNSLGDDVYITDITVQLRRPTLGAWNTSTKEIYLGEQRVDMYVTGTVQIGIDPAQEGTLLVTNLDAIFGEIGNNGEIQVLDLAADDGSTLYMEAALDYDTVSGSPPSADHGLTTSVAAPFGSGLPISNITDSSTDPDNDIENKIWIIDGIERQTSYIIPTGPHNIGLWAVDERGAIDIDELVVNVHYP